MTDKERFLRITRTRVSYFVVFLVMFLITEIGRKIYRPFIYRHDLFDFWIADTIGNFTGTITIVFFNLAVSNPAPKRGRLSVILITMGVVAYELAQAFSPRSVLDVKDIVATLVAGLISLWIYGRLSRGEREAASREIDAPTGGRGNTRDASSSKD